MKTQNLLLQHTIPVISDLIFEYSFKCEKTGDYFELGYYEKCVEIMIL